jgi:hypothetical protein
MKKFVALLIPALLIVIVAKWFIFSRLRRESASVPDPQELTERLRLEQELRDAQEQAERSRLELEQALQSANQHQTAEQSLRAELARLKAEASEARPEVERAPDPGIPQATGSTASVELSAARPTRPAWLDSYVLDRTNVDASSVRVFGPEGSLNVVVRLPGVPSDDIAAITHHLCDIQIDGQTIAKDAAILRDGETNAGLVLIFHTRTEAEAAAAALRGSNRK